MDDENTKKDKNRPKKKPIELWDADPNCDHKLDPNCYSGIRCLKCPGWFCY